MKYISEVDGDKPGIFIPIDEWKKLIKKYEGLEKEVDDDIELSEEQKQAINSAISSLNEGKGLLHKNVIMETKQRYPKLFPDK